MDVISFPENSGLAIVLHAVISLSDATSCNNHLHALNCNYITVISLNAKTRFTFK